MASFNRITGPFMSPAVRAGEPHSRSFCRLHRKVERTSQQPRHRRAWAGARPFWWPKTRRVCGNWCAKPLNSLVIPYYTVGRPRGIADIRTTRFCSNPSDRCDHAGDGWARVGQTCQVAYARHQGRVYVRLYRRHPRILRFAPAGHGVHSETIHSRRAVGESAPGIVDGGRNREGKWKSAGPAGIGIVAKNGSGSDRVRRARQRVEWFRCENSRMRDRGASDEIAASDRQPKQLLDKLQLREWVAFAHPFGSPLPNHVDRLDSL